MKLAGKYRLVVEGDLDKLRIGYSTAGIGHLFERLLTGQDANMDNLSNLGISVRLVSEDQDEFIAIKRDVME